MWVQELKNGKYKFNERYTDPLTGKYKTVSLTVDKNTASIRKKMPILLAEKIEEKLKRTSGKGLTFNDLIDQYLKIYLPTLKESTKYTVLGKVNMIRDSLGDTRLDKLKNHQINRFILSKFDTSSYAYVNDIKNLILRILRFGIQQGYLNDNRILNVYIPDSLKRSRKRNDLKYLERDELDYVLANIKNEEYRRFCTILVNTGMRFGELSALDISDVDLNEQSISITKNYDYVNKIITSPKSGMDRVAHFNESLVPVFKEQIAHTKKKMVRKGIRGTDQLFMSKQNGYMLHSTLNNQLKKINVEGKVLSSHIFRHTYISMAAEKNIPLDYIARQVGHADLDMIQRVYKHMTKKSMERQKEILTKTEII